MLSFEKTSLWRNSFGNAAFSEHQDAVNMLRTAFLNMRIRAEHLVAQISKDLPDLTVHDITHLDALWETASLIAGDKYPLNPAEAFVFGGALLLHDSAMSLAAYPGGVSQVLDTPEWRDAVATRLMSSYGDIADASQLDDPPEEIKKGALRDFLRSTHASRAAELPFIKWLSPDGNQEALIQDSELRSSYGDIIGQIAASHWWPVQELRTIPPRINAGEKIPADWFVDPLKIACLLRVADAAHIDHRRAPRFLRALNLIEGESSIHWMFQAKLGKPSIDKNFLVYTGSPFAVGESEAWWLGYDMISSVDDELRAVEGILDGKKAPPFAITAVKGAKSPKAISELVPTKNWIPVDTELQVSDVPSLVSLLGGQHLYGADLSATLREILQNAADSITAKRLLCELDQASCRIKVSLSRTTDGDVLEFEDDGIGMSPRVLTGALLDFGKSFWRSGTIRQEFPGLLSKGLRTTGRFGIGFFSIFMLGDRVTVTSRRYDVGVSETHTLDFQKGLRMRPILRHPDPSENLRQPGTKIRVFLKTPFDEPGGLLFQGRHGDKVFLSDLDQIISRVSPALDVTIETDDRGEQRVAVSAGDWTTAAPETLLPRWGNSLGMDTDSERNAVLPNIRPLFDTSSQILHGRAAIHVGYPWREEGVVTVGGFRATGIRSILGTLVGETETVSRNSARPTVPAVTLRDWATEQAHLIAACKMSGKQKLAAASLVMLLGGDSSPLPIALSNGEYLTAAEIRAVATKSSEIEVYIGDEVEYDEDDDIGPRSFENNFEVSSTLFIIPRGAHSMLDIGNEKWPACVEGLYLPDSPKDCCTAFETALANAWGSEPEFDEDQRVVGECNGSDINRRVTIYMRKIDTSDLFQEDEPPDSAKLS